MTDEDERAKRAADPFYRIAPERAKHLFREGFRIVAAMDAMKEQQKPEGEGPPTLQEMEAWLAENPKAQADIKASLGDRDFYLLPDKDRENILDMLDMAGGL
jgi:hypothetical protein